MTVKHVLLTVLEQGGLIVFAVLATMFAIHLTEPERIRSEYHTTQVQQFDRTTFTEMRNDFTGPSDDAQRYSKNKSDVFKKMLLTHALKKNNLNTLIQIYKKDPTKINKIYALACAWNMRYDQDNLTKYGKSLNYYTQHLTKQDQKLISPFLQQVISSCIGDPTGKEQKEIIKMNLMGLGSDTPIEK